MKNTTKRRLISFLLALVMVLALAPTALLEGEDDGGPADPPPVEEPGDPTPPGDGSDDGSQDPGKITKIELNNDSGLLHGTGPDYTITLEPNATDARGIPIKVVTEPDNTETQKVKFSWKSSDSKVVSVSEGATDNGHSGSIYGHAPGRATVTISDGKDLTCTIDVTVSGITLSDELKKGISILENNNRVFTVDTDYKLFGSAKDNAGAKLTVSVIDAKPNVVVSPSSPVEDTSKFTVEGRKEGKATVRVTVTAAGHEYWEEFPVTVESNESIIEYTDGCSPVKPLKFSELEHEIAAQCKEMTTEDLASVIDLRVPTNEGVLYLGYKSPEDTGAGVGSSVIYYASTGARGPYIKDITFLPNPSFGGEKATISYTGRSAGGRTFKGKILVTITDDKTDLTISTKRDTPLLLDASIFSRACQEQVGAPLDYVVFTLPPASEGALYLDYKDEWNYAAKVSSNEQYNQAKINTITFVPAAGFVGSVHISYAGYSVSGSKYSGELVIQVKQGLDDAIVYNDGGAGYVTFDGGDFDDFSENATGKELGRVSFTPPPASQGKLYVSWSGSRGREVDAGDTFSSKSLDRVTFVAADGFDGVVRIPFNGENKSGSAFQGTVEVHIQSSGASRGDISYVCAAGQSVKLALPDFTSLCESLTGQRLHYISFQALPDFNQGALYHNRTSSGGMGTRVTTATKYFNSATPYLSNLSFWATQNFRGSVEIPFTGCAVNGQTFTAVLSISNGEGAGSGVSNAVSYAVTGQNPARFSGNDFDTACRQATNEALSYIRLSLPSSGQGILYYDYRTDANPTALDISRNLFRSGEVSVDRVSFVAAKGFTGVAYIPYTGWSIKGQQFNGTVQVTVHPDGALGGLVRHETTGAPVHLSAYSIQEAAGGLPVSLRLTGLPDASQGKLYYEYISPTRYSWQGNTSTEYSLYGDPSVSNLTFVPKAGYYGEVNIPYTAKNQDGTSYSGAIRIMVNQPYSSANFNDLDSYSTQAKSAVDYLYALGVVNGVGGGRYDPGASIRRGDFCLMLARAFQFNVGSSVQGFSDVPTGAYYAQAVNQLYALGIVNGVGGGKFSPSSTVSRQDAALMVQRALRQAGMEASDGNGAALAAYSDRGQVSGYAQGAVSGLVQLGLLPTSGGKLSPKANLNRVDMAVLLHRAMTQ